MKLKLYNPTGLCFICGKPTKLLIHTPCGKIVDESNKKLAKYKKAKAKRNQDKYKKGIFPSCFFS
jgi:hypothetical protein